VHSLLRGGLLFAVPLLRWPAHTGSIVNGLLALVGAAPVSAAGVAHAAALLGPVVLVGHLLLWGSYWASGQGQLARTDVAEVALLSALLVVLPPVLSAGVYFVFWHSLQHVRRMNQLMGSRWAGLGAELRFFLRQAAPLLLVSVAGLVVLYSQPWVRAGGGPVLLSLALLVASVVTLPHALLVTLGLDAARWRQPAPATYEDVAAAACSATNSGYSPPSTRSGVMGAIRGRATAG
jgi:Brp/Blh family beta-carotene 15,15'-monooxygenase